MLSGERVLITGVTGKAVLPIAKALAKDNEVWGLSWFANPADRAAVEAAGIRPVAVDLANPDFSVLPTNFTRLLHFAWMRAAIEELDLALRVNVEAAGLLLMHCRSAKSAFVASGMGIYSPHPDAWHLFSETDPIGRGATAYAATSPACKLGLEAVARFSARAFNLPITIARLNTVMGLPGTYFHGMITAAREGRPFVVPHDPNPHTPIQTLDMQEQIHALVEAAAVPALVVNWCGDETVTTQEAAAQLERDTGLKADLKLVQFPGAPLATGADNRRRLSITGPCKTRFVDAFARLYAEDAK